eukprot:TRINITY_DN5548_c0_g1_i1.p1 TRINITY_DN5548_c0_g1~~TRINITY_DN5548_c0_g1_i1.p1  ORF type:complete len:878 (-),score=98.80 TRINITY_DN5548_c0_g1_i1:229-2862(-)
MNNLNMQSPEKQSRTHKFDKIKFTKPVVCKICGKLIKGLSNVGYHCSVCSVSLHKNCYSKKAREDRCIEAELSSQYIPLIPVIRINCIDSFLSFLYHANHDHPDAIPKKFRESIQHMMNIDQTDPSTLNEDMAQKIFLIWSNKSMKELYNNNCKIWQIPENSDYFFDHIIRIGSEKYLPTTQDIFRTRPTTGSVEKKKSYRDKIFTIQLAKGGKVELIYNPEMTIGEAKKLAHKEVNVDEQLFLWDENGNSLDNMDEMLISKLESLQIYYLPNGQKPPHKSPRGEKRKRSGSTSILQSVASMSSISVSTTASSSIMGSLFSSNKSLKDIFEDEKIERCRGIFTVTVDSASNLACQSALFEHLYIVIVHKNTDKRYRTSLVQCTDPSPQWGHIIKMNLAYSQVELSIKVWATCKNSRMADMMIGECRLTLQNYTNGDKGEEILSLKKEPKKFRGNNKKPGTIKIMWSFQQRKLKPEVEDLLSPHVSGIITVPSVPPSPPKIVPVTPKKEQFLNNSQPSSPYKNDSVLASPLSSVGPVIEMPNSPVLLPRNIDDFYEMMEVLGDGAFAVVHRGRRLSDDKIVAIKIIENYFNMEDVEEDAVRLQQEISVIQSINHHNIVQCLDVFHDNDYYYIVMEYVKGGELFDEIVAREKFPEEESAKLIRQIINALVYLEKKQICHRDLKLENLIFSDDTLRTLKLIDFGEAKYCSNGKLDEYVGTTDYMPPEVIKGGTYDTRVDMWSLGVVTYIMLCGFPPWEGKTESDIFVNIMQMQFSFPSPEWDSISDDAKNFIRSLLTDHDQRLKASQAIHHPWIQKYAPPFVKMVITFPEEEYNESLVSRIKQEICKTMNAENEGVFIERCLDNPGYVNATVSFDKKNTL